MLPSCPHATAPPCYHLIPMVMSHPRPILTLQTCPPSYSCMILGGGDIYSLLLFWIWLSWFWYLCWYLPEVFFETLCHSSCLLVFIWTDFFPHNYFVMFYRYIEIIVVQVVCWWKECFLMQQSSGHCNWWGKVLGWEPWDQRCGMVALKWLLWDCSIVRYTVCCCCSHITVHTIPLVLIFSQCSPWYCPHITIPTLLSHAIGMEGVVATIFGTTSKSLVWYIYNHVAFVVGIVIIFMTVFFELCVMLWLLLFSHLCWKFQPLPPGGVC